MTRQRRHWYDAIPGPPRGRPRRRGAAGSIRERVAAARDAEFRGGAEIFTGLLRLLGDVVLLLRDLAADPRVPKRDKLIAGVAAAYVVSPVDLVPDAIPILGQLDDILVLLYAVRRLLGAAGHDVVYECWRGTDEGLAVVLNYAGVHER